LWSVAVSLWQFNSLALSGDECPVSQPLLDLLRSPWSNLESDVLVSKLAAASCVSWAKELLESNQSVLGCLLILDP
jgi:hypothetical protein